MIYPHPIRLRGPWEYEPLAWTRLRADGLIEALPREVPPPGRLLLPGDWGGVLGQEFRGRVRFTRSFNPPTGIDPGEQIWLLIEGVDYFGTATLNEQLLGDLWGYAEPHEYDISTLVGPRNRLVIEVDLPELAPDAPPLDRPGREHLPGGLIGEVRLEIRAAW
jgi:hypothetical protein